MSQPPYPPDPNRPQGPYSQGPPSPYPPGQYPQQWAQGPYPAQPLGYQTRMAAPPKTHLVDAILVTVCCCLPFGIVAIVYAAMAKSNVNTANYEMAREYADKARMWVWI